MARFRCLTQVTDDDGPHEPGDIIELSPAQGSKALLDVGAVERARGVQSQGRPEADPKPKATPSN